MPTQSLIVGVDLAPIKAIPRVITFQSDITTDKCRASIRQYFKTWKADTVLHDGAPNVGVAWVQDAFSQAELVLQSLKLATEFLIPGGTFVTKVFRSKDYNPLLWVFKQLFTSVEATKPPSSRNVSAEIFVVCQGFKAPKHIDPKFLDAKHVFAELQDPTPNNEAKVFNPDKKKRKREGYEEGDYTQFKEIPVTEFINTTDPIAILGSYNKLSFQQSRSGDLALATLERLPETTQEIKLCCEDLKVLGKKEFRNLLRWRLKVREKFGLIVKKKTPSGPPEGEEVTEIAPLDDELAIQEELQRLQDQESSRKKKERRRENERKQKEIVRMQMNMTTPMDIGMDQAGQFGENSMFALKPVDRHGAVKTVAGGKMASVPSDDDESEDSQTVNDESDDEGDRLERELDSMYEIYQSNREERDTKLSAKKARKQSEADEWEGLSNSENGSEDESVEDDSGAEDNESTEAPRQKNLSNKAALFFDQDIFQGIDDEIPEEEEEEESNEENGDESTDNQNSADSSDGETESDTDEETAEPPVKEKSQPKAKSGKLDKKSSGTPVGTSQEEREDPRTKSGQLGMLY